MVTLFFCAAGNVLFAASPCKKLDHTAFQSLRESRHKKGEDLKLIFFSSWCSECKHHLEHLTADQVAVGMFDEEKSLQEIAVALIQPRGMSCYIDQGVGESLGVRSLPATVVVAEPKKN